MTVTVVLEVKLACCNLHRWVNAQDFFSLEGGEVHGFYDLMTLVCTFADFLFEEHCVLFYARSTIYQKFSVTRGENG